MAEAFGKMSGGAWLEAGCPSVVDAAPHSKWGRPGAGLGVLARRGLTPNGPHRLAGGGAPV